MKTEIEIPKRRTPEFANYAANVMLAAATGANIEYRPFGRSAWEDPASPCWDWDGYDYRVKPAPHPIDQWRAMSPEERAGKVLECDGGYEWVRSIYSDPDVSTELLEKDKRRYDYRIRSLTLAERNAEVRTRWEAMTPIAGRRLNEEIHVDSDGKWWICEFYNTHQGEWVQTSPSWMEDAEYRIVPAPEPPKPRYVPWTRETCPVGAVICQKGGSFRSLIIACNEQDLFIGANDDPVMFARVFEMFEMPDGSPCGTLEAQP